MVVEEAALVIKVGFELFYPTSEDCSSLLEHAMEGRPNVVLLHAVMDRLSESSSVASMLQPLITASPNDFELDEFGQSIQPFTFNNLKGSTADSMIQSPSSKVTTSGGGDGGTQSEADLESSTVDGLMSDLLSHAVRHLQETVASYSSSSTSSASTAAGASAAASAAGASAASAAVADC